MWFQFHWRKSTAVVPIGFCKTETSVLLKCTVPWKSQWLSIELIFIIFPQIRVRPSCFLIAGEGLFFHFFLISYSKLDSTRPTVRFHPILGTTFNIKDFFRDHIAKISTNNWFLKQNQKLMITLSYRYGATLFRSLSFIHQAFSLSLKLMHMRVWILDCLYTASCIS